jgi:hypothetical protein
MKLSATILCYNDEATIGGTIRNLKRFTNDIWVMMSIVPYFGTPSPLDRSELICKSLGAKVVKGNWKLDHFQRNAGLSLCKDSDWVFTFDSDELMTCDEIEKMLILAGSTNERAICNTPEVYWYDIDHVLSPRSPYSPPIMCKPDVRFTYIRNINCNWATYEGTMHHLSWCKPKDILKKVTNYAHATDFEDPIGWYENHFVGWQEDSPAVMPDGNIFTTAQSPLPQELRGYLELQ